jgi:hypothetical protein
MTPDEYTEGRRHLADLIFPEAKAWLLLSALPAVTPAEISPDGVSALLGAEGCEPSAALNIRDSDVMASIHKLSLARDDKTDLIFSGPALCHEGYATAVWRDFNFGAKPAWQSLDFQELIRVRPGPQPQYVERRGGCCAETNEEFRLGTMFVPGKYQRVPTSALLVIPAGGKDVRRQVSFTKTVPLRLSPSLEDKIFHDNDLDQPLDGGNIAAKYGRLNATQLLSYTGQDKKTWALVLVEPKSTAIDASEPTSVGWLLLNERTGGALNRQPE